MGAPDGGTMGGDPAARGERGARARGGRAAARGAGALAALPRGVLALAPAPPGQAARHRAPYAASGDTTTEHSIGAYFL